MSTKSTRTPALATFAALAFALTMTMNVATTTAQDKQEKTVLAAQQLALESPTTIISEEISTNETTTQFSYTPARVDMVSLKKNLQYPVKALAEKIEGRIDVLIYLNDKGEPVNVNFESASPLASSAVNVLAAAAFDAVKQCKFTPATRNSVPVRSALRVPVKFIL
jgi:TonB family protein